MTVRFPLIWDHGAGSIRSMTEAQRQEVVNATIYEWGQDASVYLTRVGSSGNLGNIPDTRLQASTTSVSTGNNDTNDDGNAEYSTPGSVSQVDVVNAYVNQSKHSPSNPTNARPVYYDSGNIKVMSQADVQDTFICPALLKIVDGTDRPGTHRIHTATSLSNHYLVNASPIFTDTIANAGAYTSGGITETRDQPTNQQSYYLMTSTTTMADPTHKAPLHLLPNGDLHEYHKTTLRHMLRAELRYAAVNLSNFKVEYGWFNSSGDAYGQIHSSAGSNRGSGITDTKLNSDTIGRKFVANGGGYSDDRYHSQRFPSGSATGRATFYLRIRLAA